MSAECGIDMPAGPTEIVVASEKGDAGHVEIFSAEAGGQPGADGQDDGVGNEIAGEDPGGFVGAGAEAAGNVWQGDVGDGGVEHLHEGGEGDGNGDQPGVMGRAPEDTFGR